MHVSNKLWYGNVQLCHVFVFPFTASRWSTFLKNEALACSRSCRFNVGTLHWMFFFVWRLLVSLPDVDNAIHRNVQQHSASTWCGLRPQRVKPVWRMNRTWNNWGSVRLHHLSLCGEWGFGPERGRRAQTGSLLSTNGTAGPSGLLCQPPHAHTPSWTRH